MGSAVFKQYDRRWKYNGYAGDTMWASGCGPTAMADIIYAKDTGITPWTVASWLTSHGYASNGSGTYWSGIKAGLEAFGFPTIWHDTMQQMFNELAKGDRWGILLFRSGSRGGIRWTGSGHFVAVRDYKYQNGEHMLMIGDPGSRNHDGWYSYERHMQGLIIHCWTCYLPGWKQGAQAAPQLQTATYRVNSNIGLNVRSGAGMSYARVGGLSNGTAITITQTQGGWGYSPDAGGWVCMDYLVQGGNVSSYSSFCVGSSYTVVEPSGLKVRTGAGTGYRWKRRGELTADGRRNSANSNYAILLKGTRVTCLAVSGNWIKIPSGWICTREGDSVYVR